MAVGAGHALAAMGSVADARWVPRTGVDGLPEGGQRLVRAGQLAATVVVPSNTGPALQALARFFREGAALPAETLLRPSSFPELHALSSSEERVPARAAVR